VPSHLYVVMKALTVSQSFFFTSQKLLYQCLTIFTESVVLQDQEVGVPAHQNIQGKIKKERRNDATNLKKRKGRDTTVQILQIVSQKERVNLVKK